MPSCAALHGRKGFGWQCPLVIAADACAREVVIVVYLLCYQRGMLESTLLGISMCALYYLILLKTLSQTPGKLLLEYCQKEIKMKYYIC